MTAGGSDVIKTSQNPRIFVSIETTLETSVVLENKVDSTFFLNSNTNVFNRVSSSETTLDTSVVEENGDNNSKVWNNYCKEKSDCNG